MRSRRLAQLDAAIAQSRQPVRTACLKAERAAFLARQGHLLQARRIIDDLHAQFAWGPHKEVVAWLALAEGLHEHYSHLGAGSARDKVRRAHTLSNTEPLADLHAQASAWLAHLDYVLFDYVDMVQHVKEAFKSSTEDQHATRARANLVVAEAYHFAGRVDQAQAWYARSRVHAAAEGDEAHLSALMHNQAWLRSTQARMGALFGADMDDAARQALLGAESTGHFDAGVGTASLGSLVPMLRAQALTVLGRHEEALDLFDRYIDAALREGLHRLKAGFFADMAWCRIQLGDMEGTRLDVAAARSALMDPTDVDDRAMAQARLAQVMTALGEPAAAQQMQLAADKDLQVHRAEQARLAGLLDEALQAADSGIA